MEERESVFKLATVPGLISGIINVGILLVIWATVSDMQTQQYIGMLSWLVLAFLLFFYTKNYRENNMDGSLSYGESFKFMLSMSLIIAIISSIYTYILMAYLDPEMITRTLELAADKSYANNMPEEQIEMQLNMMRKFMTPTISAIWSLPVTFVIGLVLSLIMSIFTKNEVNIFEEE